MTRHERATTAMMGVIGVAVTAFGVLIRLGVVGFAGPSEDASVAQLLCAGLCTLLGLALIGSAVTGLRAGRVLIPARYQQADLDASAPGPFDVSRFGAHAPRAGRGWHDPVDV